MLYHSEHPRKVSKKDLSQVKTIWDIYVVEDYLVIKKKKEKETL